MLWMGTDTANYVLLLLCIGLGYYVGKLRIGMFTVGATLGTLLVSIAANLLVSGLGAEIRLPGMMKTFFFALFSFTLGFDAGPVFLKSLRETGARQCLKLVLLSVIYCLCVFVCAGVISRLFGIRELGRLQGLLAGAQTQSSITSVGQVPALEQGSSAVAYAITYVFGTVGMILFAQRIAPAMLRMELPEMVRQQMDRNRRAAPQSGSMVATRAIQLRAYVVNRGAWCIGCSIDLFEKHYGRGAEIETVFRKERRIAVDQSTIIREGDVLTVMGGIDAVGSMSEDGLEETTESRYLAVELIHVHMIVTETDVDTVGMLTGQGILLQRVERRGRRLTPEQAGRLQKHDVLVVTGPARAVAHAAQEIGYIKDRGAVTDVPVILLTIALGALLGEISLFGLGIKLGGGCCAMLLGMAAGCLHTRYPRYGRIPDGAGWLMRSLGLNLFIAVTALSSALTPEQVFSAGSAVVFAAGILLTLMPPALSLLIGRHVLHLAPTELLGGLCGSATCTAALTAVEDETGSGIFTVSYAPAYVVSNILLTLIGILLIR